MSDPSPVPVVVLPHGEGLDLPARVGLDLRAAVPEMEALVG